MKHIAQWGIIGALFVVTGAFFYQTVLFGRLPVPSDTLVGLYHPWRDLYAGEYPRGIPYRNFLITDPVRQQIPWRKAVIDAYKGGALPKYNPYSFFGVPLDANVQAAPFYPLNILFFVMDFPYAWTVLIMLQPLLSGLFLYWYLRNLSLSRSASLLGSIVWGFGGFSVAWLTWGTIGHTVAWAPLVLLAIDRLVHEKKHNTNLPWAGVLGVGVSLMVFGGHMQVAFSMMLLAFVYALCRLRQHPNVSAATYMLLGLAGALVVTSMQWGPFMVSLFASGRFTGVLQWKNEGWFLPWQHLVQFVAPDYFGNPATGNYWGVWNYGEFIGYIGIIPLILALSAVSWGGTQGIFTAAILISLASMLPSFVSRLPFELGIPVLRSLQPTRLMAIVDLSLSVLAAFGFDALRHPKRTRIVRSVVAVGSVLVVLWVGTIIMGRMATDSVMQGNLAVARRNLTMPTAVFVVLIMGAAAYRFIRSILWARVLLMALILVATADLFRFGWKFTPFTPVEYFFPETKILTFLRKQPKPFRVMALDDRILPPNTNAYYGIETIEGYDPVAPVRYEDVLVASERGKPDITRPTGFNRIFRTHNPESALLPFFNVRYVLSFTDLASPPFREVMREGETRVYEYRGVLPRAYFAEEIIYRKDTDALSYMFENAGKRIAVTDAAGLLGIPVSGDETVTFREYAPQRMELTTASSATRLVVLLNQYDQRWQVTVDGKPAPLHKVNYVFMGITVPEGTHSVILTYR